MGRLTHIREIVRRNRHTYTEYSLVATAHVAWLFPAGRLKDRLLEYAAVNAFSIFVVFHASAWKEIDAWKLMRLKTGLTRLEFQIANAVAHQLPCLLLFWRCRKHVSSQVPLSGLRTAYLHVLWALVTQRGLDLSDVYVRIPKQAQAFLWFVTLAGHLLGARLVSMLPSRQAHPRALAS